MKKLSIIENEIKKIFDSSKEFVETYDKLNDSLNSFSNNIEAINDKRIKLLNILLTHSKKKVLFTYKNSKAESEYEKEREYEVGINKSGLGIKYYGCNLTNIADYYIQDRFFKFCEDKDFVNKLIESIKDKDTKKIIPKLITKEKYQNEKEEKEINGVIIEIQKGISFKIPSNRSWGNALPILKSEDISFDDDEKNLTEIADCYYDFDYNNFMKFTYLLERKDKIIPIMKNHIKKIEENKKSYDNKLNEINDLLKPYEALTNI